MGPGFFPKAVSGCLIVLGTLVLLFRGGDLPHGEDGGMSPLALASRLRIIVCVIASIIIFAAVLIPLGLPLAIFLMVIIAGLGHRGFRPLNVLMTAFVLATLTTILFPWLLGLQIPVFPQVFA